MLYSSEWTEYHLSRRGWERGSERVDFGRTLVRETPRDRVLTGRWIEEQETPDSELHCEFQVVWQSPDIGIVEQFKAKFGEPPASL